MNETLRVVRAAFVTLLLLALVTGVAYPVAVLGGAQLLAGSHADGSLVRDGNGVVVGSSLIGQGFESSRYFWGRPSAVDYDAGTSGGSNYGPTSADLRAQVEERAAALREAHGLAADATVPAELVTASGSGLDPDISPDAARFQVERVAAARGLPVQTVRDLVESHIEARTLGVLGEARVNVLKLNLALDELDGGD
ncbi:MAG: potassium-transporting ATPase subunit KdpC [Dehalococcoidia bacterium]